MLARLLAAVTGKRPPSIVLAPRVCHLPWLYEACMCGGCGGRLVCRRCRLGMLYCIHRARA